MKAIALYNCTGEDDSELSFIAGEVIFNVAADEEKGWFRGTINGKTGLFPGNYVRFEEPLNPGDRTVINSAGITKFDQKYASPTEEIASDAIDNLTYKTKENFASVPASNTENNPKPALPVRPLVESVFQSDIAINGQNSSLANKEKVKPPTPLRPSSMVAQKKSLETNADEKRMASSSLPPKSQSSYNTFDQSNLSIGIDINSTIGSLTTKLGDMFQRYSSNGNGVPLVPFRRSERPTSEKSSSLGIQPELPSRTKPELPSRPIKDPLRSARDRYIKLYHEYDHFATNSLSSDIVYSIWTRSQLDFDKLASIWY
jgi:hypothetical protein